MIANERKQTEECLQLDVALTTTVVVEFFFSLPPPTEIVFYCASSCDTSGACGITTLQSLLQTAGCVVQWSRQLFQGLDSGSDDYAG